MNRFSTTRHALAIALLAAGVSGCASGGGGATPSAAPPLETTAPPEGGVPGKVLDAQMIKGSQPPMLRYIVRLDDGRNLTVEEPAGRYLGNGDLVYVVQRDGKPYLVKR